MKIIPSDVKGKKYSAYFMLDSGKEKKVNFGAKGYRDFTLMNDKESKFYEPDKKKREAVKARYLKRHERNGFSNPMTPNALARWVLWNKPTLGGSIAHFKNKFKL